MFDESPSEHEEMDPVGVSITTFGDVPESITEEDLKVENFNFEAVGKALCEYNGFGFDILDQIGEIDGDGIIELNFHTETYVPCRVDDVDEYIFSDDRQRFIEHMMDAGFTEEGANRCLEHAKVYLT